MRRQPIFCSVCVKLSIQSANGIYDSGNRDTLNAEVQQLKAEIDRIAETTTFNGLNILDGSLGTVGLQVGEKANQTIDLNIQNVDTKTLGLGSTSVDVLGGETTLAFFDSTTAGDDLAYNDVLINGQSIVKLGESFDLIAASGDTQQDLIDAINTNVQGVSATTVSTIKGTQVGSGVIGTTAFKVTVEGLDGTNNVIEVKNTENMDELVDKLNDQSNGLISASLNDKGYLVITSENSASIQVDGSSAATTGMADATNVKASIALTSDNGEAITIERGSSGTLEDLAKLGFRENNIAGLVEGNEVKDAAGTDAFAVGDLTINGVSVGKSDDEFLNTKIDAINKVSDETGVSATAFSTMALDFAGIGSIVGGGIKINGVDLTLSAAGIDVIATEINSITKDTGITASKVGNRLILEGEVSAITIGLEAATPAAAFKDGVAATIVKFQSGEDETAGTASAALGIADNTANGGIKLTSENGNPIGVEHKDAAARLKSGLLDSNASADGKFGAAVNSLDISTAAGANKAIAILDSAIETVSEVRGDLGAVSNRLSHTISNLANVSENASAARSQIMDADFAVESGNLSRAQVLQQAGNAMLAQANARPQQVLSLLQ